MLRGAGKGLGLKNTIRGIIFDLDGTLLDTEFLSIKAINTVLAAHGGTGSWSVSDHLGIIGMKGADWTRKVLAKVGDLLPPLDLEREWERTLGTLLHEAAPLPGAAELVARLGAQGCGAALAIATSSNASAVAQKRIGHEDMFDAMASITTGNEVQNGKPAPDIFLLAAQRLNLPPAACLVVEDSPAGVSAAKAAGMRVVAVPHAAMVPAQVASSFADADLVLQTLSEWPFEDDAFQWNAASVGGSGSGVDGS